jgi:DNA invertase Pin-like site-specific DNA recombinase
MKAPTKAYAYLRVSSRGQQNGDGFPRQLKEIQTYAKQNGVKIQATFKEVISGKTMPLERPLFAAMLEELLANGTRTVIVEALHRLSRDLMVQETIIHEFKRRGLTLISAQEPDLDDSNPTRKMIRQFMGAIAEWDKTTLVLKLRGARERIKETLGRCEGNKPYGSKPGEAEVLKRILADSKKPKYTANRIATELNRDGIPTRSGGQWYGSNVLRIVKANNA